jgi:hypothetical protein
MVGTMRRVIAVICVAAASRGEAQQPAVQHPPLRGQVRSPTGLPLPDAEVTVDGITGSVHSDAQGMFSIPNVARGIWTIGVRRIGYLPGLATVAMPQGNDTLLVTLVPAHPELDTVRVTAQLNVLAGIVVDERNRPIAGASVDLIGSRYGTATTGADGWFRFTSVRSGPVIFRAMKHGYVATTQSVQLRDWRGVVIHMEAIDSTLSAAKQALLAGTGNSSSFVWAESNTRMGQRGMQSVIVTSEELAPLSDLTLGEAVMRTRSASSLIGDLQRDNSSVCVLLNGNRMVGQTSLDVYDTGDVEYVELYPPGTELSGTIAAYMRFAGCRATRTLATGKVGVFYAVVWLKN